MGRRHIGIGVLVIASLLPGAAVPASAQSAKDVTESLCQLFSRKDIRSAFAQRRVGFNDEQPGSCYWGVDQGDYGGDLQLEVTWSPVAFDDLRLVTPDATDLSVRDRRARFSVGEGQVVAVGEGLVTRDIYSDLLLDLDQGPLSLHLTDTKGGDRQQTLVGLGELVVARAGQLVAPPPLDATLAALVPATIGGQPTLVERVLYPSQELCSRCESGKALRAELKAQGKSFADVSMITASGVDPARVGQQDFRQPAVRALRVAGGDAAGLVEPIVTHLGEGLGVPLERVDGAGVVALMRPEDEYNFPWTSIVYPQADTVWVVTAEEPIRGEILAALPGAPTPPPLPTPVPTPTPDASTPEGWFRTVLPASLGGERLRIADVSSGDGIMLTPDALKDFKAVLKKQGKTIDDLSTVIALTASGLAIQGYRIAGGQGEPLMGIFVDLLREGGALGRGEQPVETLVGGKTVFTVESPQGAAILYPGGEALWIMEGLSGDVAAELISGLP